MFCFWSPPVFRLLILSSLACIGFRIGAAGRQSSHYVLTTETMDFAGVPGGVSFGLPTGLVSYGAVCGLVGGEVRSNDNVGRLIMLQGGYLTQLNNAPVPGIGVVSRRAGLGFSIGLAEILDTALDPDGDSFTVVFDRNTDRGGVVTQTDRFLNYLPVNGLSGFDAVRYRLTDDLGDSSSGFVTVAVLPTMDGVKYGQLFLEILPEVGTHLVLAGALGESYQLQMTDLLVPPVQWKTLTTMRGTIQPGLFEAVDPTGGLGGPRFYRASKL